jgi:hypothetical protein
MIGIAPHEGALVLPPEGRNLHLIPVASAAERAERLSAHVTTYAVAGGAALEADIARALPHARPATIGRMQCPAFDGPVDRRGRRSTVTTFFNSLGRSS